ncbi:hypothetical protein APR40_03565 [Salegentibacter salarius]|uniref:Uncharacterized protein n=1 Tax=Salegentibacter salarius TaxID=435906 RepID=A0A2N0TRI6_9FLAO|nr:hypothetical protein BHS39_03565 [Salegentibacter salarius]PKD17349.1 hypothetical protein APR40_03565 [Salegentibacter salarius]SLJ89443.1 hypothetical protein SAMN05660445_00817 [Salegentibacter salarius]
MNLKDYLIQYTQEPDRNFRNFPKEKTEKLFLEFKSLCYNPQTYKWSRIKDCTAYIKSENIDPEIFIRFSHYLINRYYKLVHVHNSKGKNAAFTFLKKLQASKKLTSRNGKKIKLSEGVNKIDFLLEMKTLNKFLDLTNEEWVDFILSNFELNLSKATLLKYYYTK